MADGTQKPIGDLQVGDQVVSGFGHIANVTAKFDQGVLPVIRIGTRAGREVFAEKTHRFLTQDGWKRVEELSAYSKKVISEVGNRRLRGDYLQAGSKFTLKQSSLTTDEARFLGYMTGDGCCSSHSFTNADTEVVLAFRAVVKRLGGNISVDSPISFRPTGSRWHFSETRELCSRVGLSGDAHTKRVPSEVMTAPIAAVAAFVAAYFECDGTGGTSNGKSHYATSISSVSKGLLRDTQFLMSRLGIPSSLRRKAGKYRGQQHISWNLLINDEEEFYKLPIIGAKAKPGLKRVQQKETRERWSYEGLIPDQIISLEAAGEAHCYCITVDRDDSFIANGLVTHNTESILHFLARHIKRHPEQTCAYVSYEAGIAQAKSKICRDIAERAGVKFKEDSKAAREWRTKQGGGLIATGVGGPLTGYRVDLMVIDDPIRNRETAESPVYQQKIVDWAKSTAFTRLSVKGSIIINMARWSDGDLIGRLLDEGGRWEHLNLPAILDEDLPTERSLWEAGRPLWWLKEQRRELGPYQWSSLYEGKPQPRGGALFKEPSRYRFAEVVGARFAIACDPAASAKTSADHSAIVVVAAVGDGIDQKVYVLEAWRGQVEIPHLVHQLKVMQERWRCPVYVESAGGFKAVAQVLRQIGGSSRTQSDDPLRIVEVPPRGDKFTRALPVAAAWNDGRVLLPATPEPWLPDFLAEVTRFTGKGDRQDDQVDALSHAFTAIDRRVSAVKRGPQSMRY